MDIADACCQHINAQLADTCALIRVCNLAAAQHAVFLAADCAYLSLNRDAFGVSQCNDFLCLFYVLFDAVFGAVEHNRGEALLDTFFCCLIAAVVQMQSNRNGDAQLFDHAVYHADDGGVATHVLACTLGNAQNNRGIIFLSGQQDGFGPLQVVDVEVTHCVVTRFCFVQHFFCRN